MYCSARRDVTDDRYQQQQRVADTAAMARDNACQSRDEGARYRQQVAPRRAPVVAMDENDVNWLNALRPSLPPTRHSAEELSRRPTVITDTDRRHSDVYGRAPLRDDLLNTYVPATRCRSDVETDSDGARALTRFTTSRDSLAPLLHSTAGQS